MAVGDIYRLSVRSQYLDTNDFVNVFHYRQELVVIGDPAEDLANQWVNDVSDAYNDCLPQNIHVKQISVRPVAGIVSGFDVDVDQAGGQGTGDIVAFTSAPIITWRTGFTGRSRRGRSYLPPPVETAQANGIMTGPALTGMDNFAEAAIQLLELAVVQWQMVVWSATLQEAFPVTSWVSRPLMGTMRKRRQGVGS